MISIELLRKYGAVEKRITKGQVLFKEGDKAVFYYQILEGVVKMNNYNEEGREIIQGIFRDGQSFGEPAIFGNFSFPAFAEAVEDSRLICLNTDYLTTLLKENFEVHQHLLEVLSKRLRYKAILSKEIKGYDAEHRIMALLNYLKSEAKVEELFLVNITRQTIADLTGLRVETVIRAIKKLEELKKVTIIKKFSGDVWVDYFDI